MRPMTLQTARTAPRKKPLLLLASFSSAACFLLYSSRSRSKRCLSCLSFSLLMGPASLLLFRSGFEICQLLLVALIVILPFASSVRKCIHLLSIFLCQARRTRLVGLPLSPVLFGVPTLLFLGCSDGIVGLIYFIFIFLALLIHMCLQRAELSVFFLCDFLQIGLDPFYLGIPFVYFPPQIWLCRPQVSFVIPRPSLAWPLLAPFSFPIVVARISSVRPSIHFAAPGPHLFRPGSASDQSTAFGCPM
jgi:hypothetical protein